MKIAHVVFFPPFRDGIGTVCYYYAKTQKEMGIDVKVYAPDFSLKSYGNQFNFYQFMPRWLSIGNAYLTPKLLSIKGVDLIHLHFPFIFGSELTTLVKKFRKIPMIVNYHSDLLAGGIRKFPFYVYNRLNAPWILKNAAKIVVSSLDYGETAFFGNTLFKEREEDVLGIGYGVDVNEFRPEVESDFVRVRHEFGDDDKIVLFVSSLDASHKRKGLFLLLEAFSKIIEDDIKLLVVGDGDIRWRYEAFARKLGLQERVEFAGRVSQSELPGYYVASDMVVIPSLPPEAFGLALAQGEASGKPVVGSNIAGVRLVVKNGETGFLIVPNDLGELVEKIKVLAGNESLRIKMGNAGRKLIKEKFSWESVSKQWLSVYEEVLKDKDASS